MYSDYTDIYAVAKAYSQLGFSLFPVHSIDDNACTCGKADCRDIAKHPLTAQGCKDATKNPDTLTKYFSGDYSKANIAVATGDVSGVSVIDVDNIDDYQKLISANEPFPQTWMAETGSGGKHFYFRHDERWHGVKNAVKFAGGLDVRTTGGYVLLPPSLHRSGNRYRWIVPPNECEVASAPDWLIALLPKREDDGAPDAGVHVAERREYVCDSTHESESFTVERARTLLDRAVLFLKKTPPAISGERGHNHTYNVVCRVVELFGSLNDNEILSALASWNERCSPPWKFNELRHKLNDARKRVASKNPVSDSEPESQIVSDYPVLDSAAFHGILGEICQAIEPETEADVAGVLVTLLTCCGNVLGKTCFVHVGGDTHHTNLFSALVGNTASAKGQAWGIARYLMNRVSPAWAEFDIAYGLSSGEGLVERVSDPIDEEGTTTIAVPPVRKLLCYESEFARPVTAMRREGNTLSPILRSAWDCSTLEILTRGKSKLRASSAFVSIVAHITMEELRRLLSDSVEIANGFSNRFLWCLVRSSKSLPHGGNIHVLAPFVERLRTIFASVIGRVDRSDEANKLWESVYDDLKQSKPGAFGKSVERARPYVVRLSLIYAALDCSPNITIDHLQAALAVWRYCEDSARIIFRTADDEGGKLERKIREHVIKNPGIKRSELRWATCKNLPTEVYDSALAFLERRNFIVRVPVFDGRQADLYYPGSGTDVGRRDVGDIAKTAPDTSTSPVSPTSLHPSNASDEAIGATSTTSLRPTSLAASLPQLLEWRNTNSVWFIRSEDGSIWVAPDKSNLLTPAIEQAIRDNQEIVKMFVKEEPSMPTMEQPADDGSNDLLTDEEFYEAIMNLK